MAYNRPAGGVPPPHYTCHRCQGKGHYIDDCPTKGNPLFDRAGAVVMGGGAAAALAPQVGYGGAGAAPPQVGYGMPAPQVGYGMPRPYGGY